MNQSIKAYQGKYFQVKLQSSMGSTGYGWCLTAMPEEVALASIEYAPTPGVRKIPGGVGTHTFSFIAMKEMKDKEQTVQIKFALICLHNPSLQIHSPAPIEQVTVEVEIVPCNSDTLSGFVKYSENMATYNNAIPYGFPGAAAGHLYGYPGCADTADDCSCVGLYNYPGNDQIGLDSCGVPLKYGFPVVLKYGFPDCDKIEVDSCGSPVKYGYPALKYGYLGCGQIETDACGSPVKYGYPVVFKYGFPDCDKIEVDSCGSPVKYGYPVQLKYGYPGCIC